MPSSAAATTSDGGRRELHERRERASYALQPAAAAREEPVRPDEQHEDHGREEDRRQVLALRPSAARRRAGRVAKPIEKPPSVAGIGRLRPPSTTPASTTIVSRSAKSGVTSGFCTVSITATTAASSARDEHGAADDAVRAHAEQPRGAEVHRRRAHLQADRRARRAAAAAATRQTAATTIATIAILRMSTPRDRHRPVERRERRGDLPERPERRAARCSGAGTRPRTSRRASPPATACAAAGRRAGPSRPTGRARRAKQKRIPSQRGQSHCEAKASA